VGRSIKVVRHGEKAANVTFGLGANNLSFFPLRPGGDRLYATFAYTPAAKHIKADLISGEVPLTDRDLVESHNLGYDDPHEFLFNQVVLMTLVARESGNDVPKEVERRMLRKMGRIQDEPECLGWAEYDDALALHSLALGFHLSENDLECISRVTTRTGQHQLRRLAQELARDYIYKG
jgi:hypothetical protein